MKLELPVSWDGITVGRFQDLYPVLVSEGKLVERVPALISVLSGQPLDDILKIKISEYKTISKALGFLDTLEDLTEISTSFKVDGEKYVVDTNINNMCGAQYMDFMHFLNECKGDKNLVMQNLHNLLSCVVLKTEKKWFKRKTLDYDGEGIEDHRRMIKYSMPISLAFPIAVFFWNLWQQLTKGMSDYGSSQLKKANKIVEQVGKDLDKYGGGTSLSTT